jgi:hypothetical protein
VKDIDLDSHKVLTFIDHPLKDFLKVRGDSDIVIMAKEEHEGNYTFGLALSDINPNPLITVYTFNVTIKSQWPGRPKPSMTLNATITKMNNFGDLIINFNNDVQIVPNYTNQSYFNQSIIRVRVLVDRQYREDLMPGDLNLTWVCNDFNSRFINMTVNFLRPSAISPTGRTD